MNQDELSPVAVEILITLSDCPQHGYAIKRDIEARIGDDFVLGSGSLYQAIHRLERRGLIAESDDPSLSGDSRRGRTYQMTQDGRVSLQRELERMNRIIQQARAVNTVSTS